MDHPVIIPDLQLVIGEHDSQEVVKFLLPGIPRVLLSAHLAHTHRGSRPVMSVRDVEIRYPSESLPEGSDLLFSIHHPDPVHDPILCRNVIDRRVRLDPRLHLP